MYLKGKRTNLRKTFVNFLTPPKKNKINRNFSSSSFCILCMAEAKWPSKLTEDLNKNSENNGHRGCGGAPESLNRRKLTTETQLSPFPLLRCRSAIWQTWCPRKAKQCQLGHLYFKNGFCLLVFDKRWAGSTALRGRRDGYPPTPSDKCDRVHMLTGTIATRSHATKVWVPCFFWIPRDCVQNISHINFLRKKENWGSENAQILALKAKKQLSFFWGGGKSGKCPTTNETWPKDYSFRTSNMPSGQWPCHVKSTCSSPVLQWNEVAPSFRCAHWNNWVGSFEPLIHRMRKIHSKLEQIRLTSFSCGPFLPSNWEVFLLIRFPLTSLALAFITFYSLRRVSLNNKHT